MTHATVFARWLKRTWTNECELRRTAVCYPLRLRQKCAFKHALVSG